MSVDRSWDNSYLQKQYEAMRWLAKQGMSVDDIRLMRWGRVDESEKTLEVNKKVVILKANLNNPTMVQCDEYEKSFKIPLAGTQCEWFFIKSRIFCPWMFTREQPKSCRRENSVASLFTSDEIRAITGVEQSYVENSTINALTNGELFANIELSKANITKMKTAELERKAIEMQV